MQKPNYHLAARTRFRLQKFYRVMERFIFPPVIAFASDLARVFNSTDELRKSFAVSELRIKSFVLLFLSLALCAHEH